MKNTLVSDHQETTLKGVDKITVRVIGPSGCGKSTLVDDLKVFLKEHPLAKRAKIVVKEEQPK
jgi:ABC-type lipoprotein export system ATPase subunit